jgi:hypothetical protein
MLKSIIFPLALTLGVLIGLSSAGLARSPGARASTSSQDTQAAQQQKKSVVKHRDVTAPGPRGDVYHRTGTWSGHPY